MSKSVLVLIPCDEDHQKTMREAVPEAKVEFVSPKDLTDEQIKNVNIVFGPFPVSRIKEAVKLEFIQLSSAGTDGYVIDEIRDRSIALTNTTGAFGHAISEHMMGTLLEIYKKLHYYRDNQNAHIWKDRGKVKTIVGATIVILGLGNIGSEFAKRVKALGAYVIGIKRTMSEKPEYIDELYTTDQLDELIPRADVLAMALPNTDLTKGIMNKERLNLMKEGSVLINVGRGNALDQDALCELLEKGKLLGASLDVTVPEPLPADHKMWSLPNLVLTPHISGYFYLQETYENIFNIGKENIRRFVNGEKLKNCIDFETTYTSKE